FFIFAVSHHFLPFLCSDQNLVTEGRTEQLSRPADHKLVVLTFSLFVIGIYWEEREKDKKQRNRSEEIVKAVRRRKMGDIWTWLISFFFLIALVGIIVYQLVCLADLEFDYINPYDSASRINSVVLPEFIVHGVLCVFFLFTGHWFMSLLCLPYLYYNFQLYSKRQHLVDVTEIFNLLNWEKKKRLFKLAYIILNLFLTIFWMIYSALDDYED
ncbi:hypothetical protein EUTSA_v10009832mg, partial [Eutrema salsugineum]